MATIFLDDFNGYSDGDLNGQGSWAGDALFDVQGVTVKEGAKAVKFIPSGGSQTISKVGTLRNDGKITVYFYITSVLNNPFIFRLCEGADSRIYIIFIAGVAFYSDGTILQVIGNYSANTWFYITCEWRSSDHLARYFLDGVENALSWDTPQGGAWTNGLDTVLLQAADAPATVYVDYIAENAISSATPKSFGIII